MAGLTIKFTQTSIQVQHEHRIVLEGTQEPPGLRKIQTEQAKQVNGIFTTPFKCKALTFLHTSMFGPAMQTWIKVFDSHFKELAHLHSKRGTIPSSEINCNGHGAP
jgi:hypothetical protein